MSQRQGETQREGGFLPRFEKTDGVWQKEIVSHFPCFPFYFLRASVKLSNICYYLTVIWPLSVMKSFFFLCQFRFWDKKKSSPPASNLTSSPYLCVYHHLSLIHLRGGKRGLKTKRNLLLLKININIGHMRCQRTPGLFVSLTTVSKQPLLLKAFLRASLALTLSLSLSLLSASVSLPSSKESPRPKPLQTVTVPVSGPENCSHLMCDVWLQCWEQCSCLSCTSLHMLQSGWSTEVMVVGVKFQID